MKKTISMSRSKVLSTKHLLQGGLAPYRHRPTGFTIVELLIVIVVIAILAAISVVAYNGIQQRSRDAKRVSDIGQIAKALQSWSATTGKSFDAINAGGEGTAIGWFDGPYTSPQSVKQVLVAADLLAANTQDPINTKVNGPSFAYMVADCTTGDTTRRVVMTQLEQAPTQTMAQQLGVTCNSAPYSTYIANYKMNYGKLVTLAP